MTDKNSDEEVIYQLFIKPKGDHLLYNDEWKEQFLMEVEKEAVIELYESHQYELIGMPFYNKVNREDVFVDTLKKVGTYEAGNDSLNLAVENKDN
jgi:type III restriction enzyme